MCILSSASVSVILTTLKIATLCSRKRARVKHKHKQQQQQQQQRLRDEPAAAAVSRAMPLLLAVRGARLAAAAPWVVTSEHVLALAADVAAMLGCDAPKGVHAAAQAGLL